VNEESRRRKIDSSEKRVLGPRDVLLKKDTIGR